MTWLHMTPALLLLPLTLTLTLATACGDKGSDDTGTTGTTDGGTADGGTADGGTADGGTADGGTADGGTADGGTTDGGTTGTLSSLSVTATADAISTRETVTFTVTATYGDGSTADVTDSSTLSSSDSSILQFYAEPEGQPLLGGDVTVTASLEDIEGSTDITVSVAGVASGDLVINELLTDGGVDGDPNGDGTVDATEDEFIELVNVSGVTVDLSAVQIFERDFPGLARHTFADGTVLQAGSAIVVFGGGSVDKLSVANVELVVANNEDPGTAYGLALTNDGDSITLTADLGKSTLASLSYGDADISGTVPAVVDASLQLDPDLTGTDYVDHNTVDASSGAFSPGTLSDGSDFGGPDSVYGG